MSTTNLLDLPSRSGVDLRDHERPGVLLAGRYRLLQRLATRRRSTVWQAVDERLGRPVAAKRVQDCAEAASEARAAASVNHPGVVRIYDLVDGRLGEAWVVMEELTGASLARVLAQEGKLCAQEVGYIGHHVIEALAAIHGANLVHRDVKPSNIQLAADGRVVLMDFGLSTAPHITGGAAVAAIAGSLPYLAPEIYERGDYSPSSDLFALGMTLFTAVSGVAPTQLGSDLGLPELTGLARRVAARLTEHPQLLSVVFGLLDARVGHRMGSDAALVLLAQTSPRFG